MKKENSTYVCPESRVVYLRSVASICAASNFEGPANSSIDDLYYRDDLTLE